ncbi:MAG: hypothetical protein ACI9R3_002263 [Verrucomicrobiales bacterium]|jgi:hypothetical protein
MVNLTLSSVVSALLLAVPVGVNAQSVYAIHSGTTSIRLAPAFLASAGLSVATVTDTATAAAGFEAGFDILDSTDFTFEIDSGFMPLAGAIRHSGSVQLDQGGLGIFAVGNFVIADGGATLGKLEMFDSFFGTKLFEIDNPASVTVTGNDFAFGDSDLIVTDEFAGFLQNLGLAGQVAGQLRIDGLATATPVPEPHSALLTGIGLVLLMWRRQR